MKPRSIIHINPDDFYSSILRVKDPSLRGKALLVAEKRPRSRILSCSYEARSEGLRRGQRIEEARRLCPRGLWIQPDPSLFRRVSWKLLRFLTRKAPRVEPGLSGEAYLDVTGCAALLGPPEDLAQSLRRDIRARFSLEASAGLAANKTVSLGASIEAKKAGMVDVFSGYEAAFFEPWPIHDFPGVSESLAWKLRERGVGTAGDLARLPAEWMEGWLGPPGLTLWTRSRGEDPEPVRGGAERERVVLSRSFDEEVLDRDWILAQAAEAAADLGRILRRKILRARGLVLSILYADGSRLSGREGLEEATDADPPLIAAFRSLFLRLDAKRMRVAGLFLEARALEPGSLQGELWFPAGEARTRGRIISEVRDAARRKFRDAKALFWGSSKALFPATKHGPHVFRPPQRPL